MILQNMLEVLQSSFSLIIQITTTLVLFNLIVILMTKYLKSLNNSLTKLLSLPIINIGVKIKIH